MTTWLYWAKPKEATATTPINLNLVLNINDNVRFVGYGADVTIGGKPTIHVPSGRSRPRRRYRARCQGRYKAHG